MRPLGAAAKTTSLPLLFTMPSTIVSQWNKC